MAGIGPPPKDPAQRRRTNTDTIPRKTISDPPETYPPLPDASSYLPQTRKWYRTWATSPQAARFLATDWQRLAMLAPLVDSYFLSPRATVFAEICKSESMLGATEADRLRLRWDVAEPKAVPKTASAAPDEGRQAQIMRLIDGGKSA
jgi:hypothetical protein